MAGENPAYLAWLRKQPCCVKDCKCTPVQSHHCTGAGMSLRAHDQHAMPLCWIHHNDFHDLRGPFKWWMKEQRKLWQRMQAAWYFTKFQMETKDASPRVRNKEAF